MTEPEEDIEALFAKMEAAQKRSHRIFMRVTVTSVGTFLLLAAVNAAFVVLGGGAWVPRDLVAIGGLTTLGMLGYLGAVRAYQVVVERDRQLLERYRKEAALAETVDAIRPLMAAIEDANARGVPLLIPPGSITVAPPRTVH